MKWVPIGADLGLLPFLYQAIMRVDTACFQVNSRKLISYIWKRIFEKSLEDGGNSDQTLVCYVWLIGDNKW